MNIPDLNALTRTGTFVYIPKPICRKCVSSKLVKCGLARQKQRYMCKTCNTRFVPVQLKNRHMSCVELYTEGNSLRSIGRLLGISHVTAMRWVKLMAKKLRPPTPTYARHIEIDELYFYLGNKKRRRWLWMAICRDTKRILGFCTGGRGAKTLEKLYNCISPIRCERYYTDRHAPFYKVLPREKHRNYPNQTNTIEGINSAIRHYLARFRRRSKCYSKSIVMVEASIELLTYSFNDKFITNMLGTLPFLPETFPPKPHHINTTFPPKSTLYNYIRFEKRNNLNIDTYTPN